MGAVIKKELWTVDQIFKFVDEKLAKYAFYSWGMKEGASKQEVIDKMIEDAGSLGYCVPAINCVFNDYPLPNIVLCRARLYPNDGFSEDIGDDVWVLCSGQLVLGALYAFREGWNEEHPSWWEGESYQTMSNKASTGDKEAKERLEAFHSCKILVTRILEIDNKDDIFDINEILDCYAG